MSLIHDALKRAERDRRDPSGVFVSTEPPGGRVAEKRFVWPWMLAVTAIPAAAMAGWITWNGSPFQPAPSSVQEERDQAVSGRGAIEDQEPDKRGFSVESTREGVSEPVRLASNRGLPTETSTPDGPGAVLVEDSRRSVTQASTGSDAGGPEGPTGEESALHDETRPGSPKEAVVDRMEEPAKPDKSPDVDDRSESETPPGSVEIKEGVVESTDSGVSAKAAQAVATESTNVDQEVDEVSRSNAASSEAVDQGGANAASASSSEETEAFDLRGRHERWRSALANGDMASAEEELAEVQSVLPPDHLMRLRMEAWTAYRRGESSRAADRYRQILEARPGDGDAAINLASIYLSRGRDDRARVVIGEARKHSPESVALKQAQQRIGASR